MNKTTIEYCTHTWNPAVGCRRGCEYCYARRIFQRFYPGRPFSNITEYFERLFDPGLRSKKPKRIFVGDMSDIEYWSRSFLSVVIEQTVKYNQHEYLFLTKNPQIYRDSVWNDCGGNVLMGTTFDLKRTPVRENICTRSNGWLRRPWLSLEPLLGPLRFDTRAYEFVAVGADSTRGAAAPKAEWIRSVMDHVSPEKIVWKKNIVKYMEETCPSN